MLLECILTAHIFNTVCTRWIWNCLFPRPVIVLFFIGFLQVHWYPHTFQNISVGVLATLSLGVKECLWTFACVFVCAFVLPCHGGASCLECIPFFCSVVLRFTLKILTNVITQMSYIFVGLLWQVKCLTCPIYTERTVYFINLINFTQIVLSKTHVIYLWSLV